MGLKVSKNVILPRIDKVQDPEVKRVIQELLRVIQDMNSTYYSDLVHLESNSGALAYEEGTWTPTLTFGGASVGITYTSNVGLYTKIGRQLTVTGYITLSSKGTSTGEANITGLPFVCKDGQGSYSYPSFRLQNITFANVFTGRVLSNTTTVSLEEITEAGVKTALDNTNFANNSHIGITATYFTE